MVEVCLVLVIVILIGGAGADGVGVSVVGNVGTRASFTIRLTRNQTQATKKNKMMAALKIPLPKRASRFCWSFSI